MPPRNRIQEIVYQTNLPYYSSSILEEYEAVASGVGEKILEELSKDIAHLEGSSKKWKNSKDFERHLSRVGYNISGEYRY